MIALWFSWNVFFGKIFFPKFICLSLKPQVNRMKNADVFMIFGLFTILLFDKEKNWKGKAVISVFNLTRIIFIVKHLSTLPFVVRLLIRMLLRKQNIALKRISIKSLNLTQLSMANVERQTLLKVLPMQEKNRIPSYDHEARSAIDTNKNLNGWPQQL